MSETAVHFKFHHYLLNAIEDEPQRGARSYKHVEPEFNQDIDGSADLVLFDADEPVLVIEAKRHRCRSFVGRLPGVEDRILHRDP